MPGLKSLISALQVGDLEAELRGEVVPQDLLRAALARCADVVERLRPLILHGVEDGVGDVVAARSSHETRSHLPSPRSPTRFIG